MELVKYNKARFEKNKLTLDDNLTLEEWKVLGQQLKQVEGSVQFWIGDWARFGDKKGYYTNPKVYDELEEITGLGRGTIQNYKSVAERTSSLRNEDLSFNHHVEVAKLKPDQQKKFLDKASEENLSVRELRDEIRKSEVKKPTEMPKGIFNIIYADPPWEYDFSKDSKDDIENHYPTMPIEEIKSLEIPSAKDSVLFIWATAPKLIEALEVIEAWGFDYKTHSIWDKDWIGMGYWFRGQHELLLIATKGSPGVPEKPVSSVYTEKRTAHSKKPDYYYELIEEYFPNGKYLELFARKKHNNKWQVYGNEQF